MPMSIASASKWIYGAYVVQRRNGALNADDVAMLSMRSGYTNFNTCLTNQSVDACLAYQTNGKFSAGTSGKFDHGGGHLQKHATGSIFASPDAYARFLRKIMAGQLKIGAMLGASPVGAVGRMRAPDSQGLADRDSALTQRKSAP